MKFDNTQYKIILFFVSVIILSFISIYFSILNTSIYCGQNCDLVIYKNENAFDVGRRLDELGLIDNYYSFVLAAKLLSVDRDIKPGYYTLTHIKNMKQLLFRLTIADSDYIKVTVPEGWSIDQIANMLKDNNLVDKNKFISLCKNIAFIRDEQFPTLHSLGMEILNKYYQRSLSIRHNM